MSRLFALVLACATLAASTAFADDGWFSKHNLQGVVDLRMVAGDGLRSWVNGGFGKTRFGGAGSGVAARTTVGALDLVWKPELTDDLSLVIDGIAQPHAHRGFDFAEAYALYRPLPTSDLHVQARAGLLYVPISMEHNNAPGEPWTVNNTITPSAINSWVGEELKVMGGEMRIAHPIGDVQFATTIGVFGYNDTAGTLLSVRGWGFDDVVATAGSRFALPSLNRFAARVQAPDTVPVVGLTGRAGWYGRWDLAFPNRFALNAEWYDNNGDRRSAHKRQWSWDTTFLNVGAAAPLPAGATLTAQVISGRTAMGYPRGATWWFDVYFQSAYVAVSRKLGADTVTARVDSFRTRNRPLPVGEDYSENGAAELFCWKHPVNDSSTLLIEGLSTQWRRPSLAAFLIDPHQSQNLLHVAWRVAI